MPQRYRMRSKHFCMAGWWKQPTPGAVLGASTRTCSPGAECLWL